MATFAVWTLGADRPGIVAAVTGALFEAGCNLEDGSMTILSGQLAMVLIVEGPDGLGAGELEAAFAVPVQAFDLDVAVRPVKPTALISEGEPTYVVSVYGADRPGIVHRVSSLLADHDVNITDLDTRVIGEADHPVYAMLLEVVLPPGLDAEKLREHVAALATDLGVEASLHPSDVDIL